MHIDFKEKKAFPVPQNDTVRDDGMSLRDYIATKAMQGILSRV